MPANPRESSDTIEIGRGHSYGPMYSEFKPVRRSSTLRSDEWDYYDRSNPSRRVRYDDYRPRYEEVDVYDRPSRPVSYQDNIYYDRWQDNPVPVVRPRLRSPSPDTAVRYEIARLKGELEDLRGEERRVQRVEDASRWQLRKSKVDRDDDERKIIAERSRRTSSKPVHPVEHVGTSKVRNGPPHIPGLFQTVFDVNHPQDASIHLELPITDDHETELEKFCQLQRLGNFAGAEEYFKDHLEPYLSNPYVFVQYGQMLLEKGDYLAFERLNAEAVFGKEELRTPLPREKIVVVERDWSRPRVRSRSRSRSWSRPRERRRETKARLRSQSPVESGRQQRRTRFEPDVRIVRRRSRSRSRSRSVDSFRHYHGRDRDDENNRGQSPDGVAQLEVTKAESDFDELKLLHQNWRLMKVICNIHSKGNYEDAISAVWYTIDNFSFGAGIGSTEIQLAKLTLQLCAHIGRIGPERYHSGLREAARNWIELPTLFKELLVQGRIWDFKDLYVESVAAFSDPGVKPFFDTDDNKRSLIDDWISEEGDESTNLALLDLLLEPAQLRSVFLNETKSRAEAIIAHCPTSMRSRSFIRWILASAADALSGEKKGEDDLWVAHKTHIKGFPGLVWHSQDCFLPGVYVPRNTENPGWVAPELALVVNEPLQLALNLAKELKDYKSQVACLKLLIFQSSDPTQLFEELASLQKSMQGDKEGHLETMLSSYLICKDRPSKEKLLEELQQTDDWRDDLMLRDGLMYWSRDFIERALKRSLQGPKSTAKLRNPPGFYLGRELPWEAEQFTWQHAEHVDYPHTTAQTPYRHIRHDPTPSSRHPLQERGHQIIRPYSSPSSLSRRHFPWPEPPRPQSPPNPRDDESYNRREQEQLESARKELQLIKEKEESERRDKQDRETAARLAVAEQLARRQEEINKIQKEEMEKRAAEMKQLEQEYKLAKEKQDREARAQQDRETRERLERAEVSLRDQAERLRRAEDRPYQEWLAGKNKRSREKTRWRRVRSRRKNSVATVSLESSDTHSSDSPPSSDDEDSSDAIPPRRMRRRDVVTSSDSEVGTNHKRRTHRRRASVDELGAKRRRDGADPHDGDENENLRQNPCTDLILYSGVQITTSPDAYVAGSSLLRSTSPNFQGEVTGSLRNTNPTATHDTTTRAISSSPPTVQHLQRKGGEDLYESARGIGVDGRETPAQRQARREKEERVDVDDRERLRSRFSTHDRRSSFEVPPRNSSSGHLPIPGKEGRVEREREFIQGPEPTLQDTESATQEQNNHLTAEPEVVDQPNEAGPDAMMNIDESLGPSRPHRPEFRNRDELQSKEQNERIANRPSRPASTGRYGSPRSSMYESTGIWDAWEESKRKRADRRIIIDPSPSTANPARISERARSRPISMQELDDIRPVGRRTSRLDYPPFPPPVEQLRSPTKRQSLIIDADGRPRPIRTTSENRRSYPGDGSSVPYIVVRRGTSADGRQSVPEMPATVSGSRSQPHSMGDVISRHVPPGQDPGVTERLPAESWEKETEGVWRKKKSVSTVHEDPEEGDDEWGLPKPQPRTNDGESPMLQASLEPEQGISRKSTVADPEPNEE